MTTPPRVGSSGAPPLPPIPATAKKVVQSLKEIVKNHSDEEIYAALKDCNMDPNETVQKLITQDTFHEVRRKRNKKKENGETKDLGELPSRSFSALSARGGRIDRGGGRGNYVPRYTIGDAGGGGRGPYTYARENGSHQVYRATITTSASSQLQSQSRPSISGASISNSNAAALFGSAGMANGSPPFTRASQGSRGNWTPVSGRAIVTDEKSNSPRSAFISGMVSKVERTGLSSNVQAVVVPPSMDSAVHSSLVSSGNVASIKQEVDAIENHRANEEQGQELSHEVNVSSLKSTQGSPMTVGTLGNISLTTESKPPAGGHHNSPVVRPHTANIGSSEAQRKQSSGTVASSGTRAFLGNHYTTRVSYQPQQQPVGTQRASGLEWKPKPPVVSLASTSQASPEKSPAAEADRSSPPVSSPVSTETLAVASSKLQGLDLQEDQAVIIPNHLRVPEAERTGLSFGSFGANFESDFTTGLGLDDEKSIVSVENPATEEVLSEQPSVSSMADSAPVSIAPSYSQQSTSTTAETLGTGNDMLLSLPSAIVSQPEISKPEPATQQSQHYSYLPSVPSYHGFGLMPQVQYPYESAESQRQEVSRLLGFVQPFSDPTANYYSPAFRPGSDADARYQFVSPNIAAKLGSNVSLMTGQALPSSKELSQTAGIAHTTLAMAQQPLPIHAYPAQPAGVAISPFATNIFGYRYVPPSYTYMHTPYQHSFTGNNGFPQPPAGSSYAPGGSAYPPTGGPTVKYPLGQYKLGSGVVNAPHAAVATGYGSFGAATPGFAAVNPAVTAGSASSYDDIVGSQYKESNLYIPSQQGEGSAVWVQAPLSRDITGMQTNSYYNLQGQGQYAGYAHTQPGHAHPATGYASLYHPSQSAPGPSTHQLLQQPQALGSIGAGSQGVLYQQPQRGQLNWSSSY